MLDRIHYISQGETPQAHYDAIRDVLDAGGRLIQLRYKNKEEVLPLAKRVKVLCDAYGAMLIINDYIDVAKAVDADGVHLGLNDSSVAQARAILDDGKIVGGTANTLEDVLKRISEKCDYIGLGPFRFTKTKQNLSPILGIEGYQTILQRIGHEHKIYAIGGIELQDVSTIIEAGIYGIAASGLLTREEKTKEIFTDLKNSIDGAVENRR